MDTNTDRAEVTKNFQMSRISVPYFDVKKEKKYQDFYKIIRLVEIVCEKKIKFIEYP